METNFTPLQFIPKQSKKLLTPEVTNFHSDTVWNGVVDRIRRICWKYAVAGYVERNVTFAHSVTECFPQCILMTGPGVRSVHWCVSLVCRFITDLIHNGFQPLTEISNSQMTQEETKSEFLHVEHYLNRTVLTGRQMGYVLQIFIIM